MTELSGENPLGIPNNLVPYIQRVAAGTLPHLTVFGNDWPTRDGTGVRDYIHVLDLAHGHTCALRHLLSADSGTGSRVFNLGTGTGCSVLEVVEAMRVASGKDIPVVMGPRRDGDVAQCFADASKAESVLGWRATLGLPRMCEDVWRFCTQNPKGYSD